MTLKPPEHYAREAYVMLDGMRDAAEESDEHDQEDVNAVEGVMDDLRAILDGQEDEDDA